MTRPYQGLSSLAPGVKMRDPGNEVGTKLKEMTTVDADHMLPQLCCTVMCFEPWPLYKFEAGGDLVLIHTSFLFLWKLC